MKKYVVVGKVTSPHGIDKGVPNMHQHEVVGGDDKSEEVCGLERKKWHEEGEAEWGRGGIIENVFILQSIIVFLLIKLIVFED